MNPQEVFCPNLDCSSRGVVGAGNIGVKDHSEGRYLCHGCGISFTQTTGTPYFALKKDPDTFTKVTTLLSHGCPPRAAALAFSLDIGQVLKHHSGKRLTSVEERLVQGSQEQLVSLLSEGQKLNTAYIERLNATFRACLCALVRRGRALARQQSTLEAGMYLVGTVYNFCTYHKSLRLPRLPRPIEPVQPLQPLQPLQPTGPPVLERAR